MPLDFALPAPLLISTEAEFESPKSRVGASIEERSSRMEQEPIYLDYQATTPVDPQVVDGMLPYFTKFHGNPHAEENWHGQRASAAMEDARNKIARLIKASPREILFTSGATEANNIILFGIAAWLRTQGRAHLVTTAIEHKAVLMVFERLQELGHDITILDVGQDGLVDLNVLAAAVRDDTGLVSVMAVNNEVGVVQPFAAIGALCTARGILFHTDAAQAGGKIDICVGTSNIDFLSLSAHKLYGPNGIGAAFVKKKYLRHMEAVYRGGGQEVGLRPGTIPVPLCVGFGLACEISAGSMCAERERFIYYRTRFLQYLADAEIDFEVNGDLEHRWPGNLNLSFTGVDAEALLMSVRAAISISTGSACNAHSLEPSHVLRALGLTPERCESAVRIGFGRMTSEAEVVLAAKALAEAVHKLRTFHYSISA